MSLEEFKIQDYIYHFLKEMDNLYSFADKNVVFLSYEPNINNALIVKKFFKADTVYYINPDYEFEALENNKVILAGAKNDKFPFIKDKSIDLIIGIEILEHINNIEDFFAEIKRCLKPSGEVELQGNPIWTCHYGHHLWIENKYIFYEKSNPFEPWEHLIYDNQKDMVSALIAKGLPQEDCSEIANWIFDPIEISRHSASEIIESLTGLSENSDKYKKTDLTSFIVKQYKDDNYEYFIKRTLDKVEPNEFYKKAKEKYSEEDLQTYNLIIKLKSIKNQTNKYKKTDKNKENIDFLNDWLLDLIKKFNSKHNIKNKTVLNLSMFNNTEIENIFELLGAKKVISIFPIKLSSAEEVKNTKFDIIFGLDSLNFCGEPDLFFSKIKELSHENTKYYLTGYMPYTFGKNNVFANNTTSEYPIPYWSHLNISDKKDLQKIINENNINKIDADKILERYFCNVSGEIKISPTDIYKKASEYINVYMRRIFNYLPKNEYYQEALKKYSEEDLNTERIIFMSDFPGQNWFEELDLNQYLKDNLSDINMKYKIQNKRILNVTPYINKPISEAIESLGAEEVVSLSNYDKGLELNGGKHIKCLNMPFEQISEICGKFDIIYGLDVLEHIKDVKNFYINLKNLIKDNGVICIQGSPLWPSDNGHHCMLQLDCGTLKTGTEDGCIAPWEHLGYDSKEEMKEALIAKNFSLNDAEKISEYVFNSSELNRHSYADLINILNEIDDVYYGSKKILDYSEENKFYEKASQKYSHEELRTKELKLFIRKKLC